MAVNSNPFKDITRKKLRKMLGSKNTGGALVDILTKKDANPNQLGNDEVFYRHRIQTKILEQSPTPIPPSFSVVSQWPDCE